VSAKSTKELSIALANMEKGLGIKGKSRIFRAAEKFTGPMEVIPFGVPDIDDATGIGGLPRGRIIELYGTESGGKSWTTLKLIASAQQMGLTCAFVDLEHSFVPDWAEKAGVNIDTLLVADEFDHGEQAMDYVKGLCQTGVIDLVVLDSVGAIVPKAELEAKMHESKMAEMGRLMSRAMKQVEDACGKSGTTAVFINQTRSKVGMVFGNPETTPGGIALRFFAAMRIRVERVEKIKGVKNGKDGIVGIRSKIEVIKSKVSPPFGKGVFSIYFNPEFQDPLSMLAEYAYKYGLIKRKKNEEGKMEFMEGSGKEAKGTGCFDLLALGRYISTQEGRVQELAEAVSKKMEDEQKTIPTYLTAMRSGNVPSAPEVSVEADTGDESEKDS
jgi:recombination protein RecA